MCPEPGWEAAQEGDPQGLQWWGARSQALSPRASPLPPEDGSGPLQVAVHSGLPREGPAQVWQGQREDEGPHQLLAL